MKKIILALTAIFSIFFSCSSDDDVKSSENYIKKFTIEGVPPPVQVLIKDDQNLIQVFTFQENLEALLKAAPELEISDKATQYGSSQDWTDKDFFYMVIAENGDQRKYNVEIKITYSKYSFETWEKSNSGYWVPSDSNSAWTSGNAGISMALGILGIDNTNPENYPTRKTSEGYSGNAVILETKEGGTVFGRSVPLLSGNFFLGNFNPGKAITDELAATEVGSIYKAKPKSVSVKYKYKEGNGDFKNNGTPEPGRNDSCNMSISFYKAGSLTGGRDTTLAVKYIDDSDLVIARATKEDCSETGDEFIPYTLEFGEYISEPDFEKYYYKIAITFAASRHGGNYAGKIGSTLIIDEVEIEDY